MEQGDPLFHIDVQLSESCLVPSLFVFMLVKKVSELGGLIALEPVKRTSMIGKKSRSG